MKRRFSIVTGLFIGTLMIAGAHFGGIGGCGGTSTGGGATGEDVDADDTVAVTTNTFTSTGDLTGTGALSVTDMDGDGNQDLVANLSSILDSTGNPIDQTTLTADNFEMTESEALTLAANGGLISLTLVDTKDQTTAPLTCTWTPNSSATSQPLDISFILDTTGSMGSKVGAMTSSLSDFFDDLVAGGVAVQAGGIVYGDAFNTKSTTGSSYTVGTGSNEPPTFDTDERPFLNLVTPVSGASNDSMDTFLSEINTDCGFGCGGGDSAENTIGALDHASLNTSFRPEALKAFLVFGDNDAHSTETFEDAFSFFTGPPSFTTWQPRSLSTVQSALPAGASVFTITDDSELGTGFVNLTDLTFGAGVHVDLPDGPIDLNTLDLLEFLTAGGQLVCGGTLRCTNMNCILRILQGTRVGTWTWNVTFAGCD